MGSAWSTLRKSTLLVSSILLTSYHQEYDCSDIFGGCVQCLVSSLSLDRRINPKIAEEHAVRPYMAAQSKISEFAKSYDLKSRPHAMVWLSKVYGISAGMYASQVWGRCI